MLQQKCQPPQTSQGPAGYAQGAAAAISKKLAGQGCLLPALSCLKSLRCLLLSFVHP